MPSLLVNGKAGHELQQNCHASDLAPSGSLRMVGGFKLQALPSLMVGLLAGLVFQRQSSKSACADQHHDATTGSKLCASNHPANTHQLVSVSGLYLGFPITLQAAPINFHSCKANQTACMCFQFASCDGCCFSFHKCPGPSRICRVAQTLLPNTCCYYYHDYYAYYYCYDDDDDYYYYYHHQYYCYYHYYC